MEKNKLNIKQNVLLTAKKVFNLKNLIFAIFIISLAPAQSFANGGIGDYLQLLDCRDIQSVPSNTGAESVFAKRCHDGTHTIEVQPGSRDPSEGICGPTVGTVMLAGFCGKLYNPFDAQDLGYFGDWTPGTRPGTMKSGLNRLFREQSRACPNGQWRLYGESNGYEFLNKSLRRMRTQRSRYTKAPFVAFVRSNGMGHHYFPIVNIYFVRENPPRPRPRPDWSLGLPSGPSGQERANQREEWLNNRRVVRTAERLNESVASTQPTRVTSRNINKCRIAVNNYSKQRVYTCENFLDMMDRANDVWGLGVIYSDYTYIAFDPR